MSRKPYRRALMETYGASCIPSPSKETESGRRALAADPDSPGSMGIAISEALEVAATQGDAHFAAGSGLNAPLLHHSVIGLEAMEQMELAGYWPDVIIGCVGGGSNFSGLAAPFLGKMLRENRKARIIAAEPTACPSLTRGRYAYDFIEFGPHGTACEDVHVGLEFYATQFSCWGLASSRNFAAGKSFAPTRPDRSCRAASEGMF